MVGGDVTVDGGLVGGRHLHVEVVACAVHVCGGEIAADGDVVSVDREMALVGHNVGIDGRIAKRRCVVACRSIVRVGGQRDGLAAPNLPASSGNDVVFRIDDDILVRSHVAVKPHVGVRVGAIRGDRNVA